MIGQEIKVQGWAGRRQVIEPRPSFLSNFCSPALKEQLDEETEFSKVQMVLFHACL